MGKNRRSELLAENYEEQIIREHHIQNHQALIDFDQGLFDRRFLPIFGSSFCNQKFPMDATVAGKRLKAPATTKLKSATFWA